MKSSGIKPKALSNIKPKALSNIESAAFIGSKRFGLRCLEKILSLNDHRLQWALTCNDRSDSRSALDEWIKVCEERKLPLMIAENSKHALETLRKKETDLAFVNGWYWLFPKDIIESFRCGMIGIHNSLLPKYRGGAPLVWQMINGEKTVGSSIFKITEEMDAGDLLHQIRLTRRETDTIASLTTRIEDETLRILPSLWKKIILGKAPAKKQNHRLATYCAQRIPDDGFINWNDNAEKIVRFIRAQVSPYPGAFTMINDKKIVIEECSVWKGIYYGTPGQILKVEKSRVLVSCGNSTALWIEKLRPEDFGQIQVLGSIVDASTVFSSMKMRLG